MTGLPVFVDMSHEADSCTQFGIRAKTLSHDYIIWIIVASLLDLKLAISWPVVKGSFWIWTIDFSLCLTKMSIT